MSFTMFVMQALNGLTIAAIYILLASGLTIVMGLQKIVNAAHGVFYMLGAYFSLTVISSLGLNFWLSIPVAFICTALLGAGLERYFIRRISEKQSGHHFPMMITLGITLGAGEVIKIFWGAIPQMANIPELFQGVLVMGSIIYPKYWLFVIILTVFVMIGIWAFFNLTGLGILVRAVGSNNEVAQALGTNAHKLNTLVFAFGTGLAGIAGVLAAPILGIDSNMGMETLMPLFIIIILGGLGSLAGATLSAVIIGFIMAFGTALASGLIAKILTSVVMILILIIRPLGIFNKGTDVD